MASLQPGACTQNKLLAFDPLSVQVIHLIRHGQGFHNVAGHKNLGEYLSTEWYASMLHKMCLWCIATRPVRLQGGCSLDKLWLGAGINIISVQAMASSCLAHAYILTYPSGTQAEALHKHIDRLPERLQVDLVVSSPLTRTLETAVGVFANEEWRDNGHGAPLMAEQTEEQASRLWHVLCSSLAWLGITSMFTFVSHT